MHIEKKPFGQFWNNDVFRYTLTNSNGISVSILNYGAIIQSLTVPGREDRADIILGFDSLYGYLKGHPFFGAVAGRVANRIPDGRFSIDNNRFQLNVNAPFHNHLHGGYRGFDKYVWESREFTTEQSAGVRLHRISPDGEEDYPGTLDTTITYTLDKTDRLSFNVSAVTDRPTIANIVQHSYFNMAGHDSGDVCAQELTIQADRVTPVDDRLCPTGEIMDVTATPFDFRSPTRLETAFESAGGIYDINYVLKTDNRTPLPCARLHDPDSGRTMTVATTQPGLQFYNGHKIHDQEQTGKGGFRYPKWAGICLETQNFPNAVNHEDFPDMVLRPGETYDHTTTYTFSVE